MAEALPKGEAASKPSPQDRLDAESSVELLRRAHEGDSEALAEVCARYLPRLQRWAHGRLPEWARGALDTQDLVQDTFAQVIRHIDDFEPRHEGAFQAYLRLTLLNRLRDQIRSAQRKAPAETLNSDHPAPDPSPLEQVIGKEALERYDTALQRLRPDDREAVILRIEMGYAYAEIAEALHKPSAAAAYMTVSRALVRLAEEMSHGRA
jgi:RNA polymerase sigma-70 factor (ECF subfamily)